MKDEICCEFVAKWGLLSIYESGAYGVSNPKNTRRGILLLGKLRTKMTRVETTAR
jgi:hypothetical protein